MEKAFNNYSDIYLLTIKEYMDNKIYHTQIRGGVIIYTKDENNKIKFITGQHTISNDITDFGGGIKLGENKIKGALRELSEESFNSFGDVKYKHIQNFYIIFNERMFIIFICIDLNVDELVERFEERLKTKVNPEINKLIIIDDVEFKQLLKTEKIYCIVKNLLECKIEQLIELL